MTVETAKSRIDTNHLVALQQRVSSEKNRLAQSSTDAERNHRKVLVAQAQRELEGEMEFLGMDSKINSKDMDDDTLLAALAR